MEECKADKAIYRKNYVAYPWRIKQLDLRFEIAAENTAVFAEMEFEWHGDTNEAQNIVLNGSNLQLVSISLNDRLLTENDYAIEGESLTIHDAPASSVLKTEVLIHPAANTALEGLYLSGDFLLTQC